MDDGDELQIADGEIQRTQNVKFCDNLRQVFSTRHSTTTQKSNTNAVNKFIIRITGNGTHLSVLIINGHLSVQCRN